MKRMFLGAALMMLLCATEMMAQVNQATQTIRGHVCDVASGEPMIGVTITVENGTTLATVSDVDGNFIINNVPVYPKNLVDLGGRRIFAAEIFKKRHDYESKNDYRNSVDCGRCMETGQHVGTD